MEAFTNSTAGKSLKRLHKPCKLKVLRMAAGDEELSGSTQFTDYTPDRSSGQMFSQPPPDPFSCFATLQKLIKKKKNRGRIWMFPRVSQLESVLCSDDFE